MKSPPPSIDVERYRQLRDLVDRAAERPEAEWPGFLEWECPSDAALRNEALGLLNQERAAIAERFLEPPSGPTEASPGPAPDENQAQDVTLPSRLGKYEILRRFSEASGQAAAYLALDTDLERHVVLKRYHGASGETEEGRALAKVASPYVAQCHGVERIDGEVYLVIEYVPGRNLAEVQRDAPLAPIRAVRIAAQVAEGLAAVHARGLIHRDVKPANVILHDDGTPRLVDFGIAAYLGSDCLQTLSGSPP